jgi:MFS family permease
MSITAATISPRRRWTILILILIPVFIGALDLTIVSAILPEVLARLKIPVDTNLNAASWAVTGYLLAYTVSMTVTGRLSDLIGRRSVYLVCLGIFIAGSWWVATAHELPTAVFNQFARQVLHQRPDSNQLTLMAIIVGRVIQALGAGAMVPVSMALVADLFPPEHRAQQIGVIGAADTLGWVLGHLYGGIAVRFFNDYGAEFVQGLQQLGLDWPAPDWHTLFYLNVPIGVVAFVLTWWILRDVEHPIGKGKFDYAGAVLASLTLIGLSLGLGGKTDISAVPEITNLQDLQNAVSFNLPLLFGAILCFVAFVIVELRNPHPLIDLRLFRKRNVRAAAITNLIVGFCLMMSLVGVTLFVNITGKDTSIDSIAAAAAKTGIILSGLTVPMMLAAIPGGWLTERYGYRPTTLAGMALAAIGFLWAGLTWNTTTPDYLLAGNMILVGVGLGLTISPVATAVINDATDDERGTASALVIILRLIGMTIAIPSMLTYSSTRVGYFMNIARSQFLSNLTPEQFQQESVGAYFASSIRVIDEMLLIGAAVCFLSLLPAIFLRGSGRVETAELATNSRLLEQEPS